MDPPQPILPIASAPPTTSLAITVTPLHHSSPTKETAQPSASHHSSSATRSDDRSPPRQQPPPTRRITRGTARKRKAAETEASSKTASRKRGRRETKAIELFPEETVKPEGPSLPACSRAYISRDVIPPLIIGQELWRTLSQKEFDVAPIVSALERTGWFKLADVPTVYDPVEIRTFYSALTIVGQPPNYDCAVISWKGKPLVIDAELIAEITDLPTGEGFCDF